MSRARRQESGALSALVGDWNVLLGTQDIISLFSNSSSRGILSHPVSPGLSEEPRNRTRTQKIKNECFKNKNCYFKEKKISMTFMNCMRAEFDHYYCCAWN